MKLLIVTRTIAEFANLQGKLNEIAKRGIELTVVSPAQWAGKAREVSHVDATNYKFLIHKCRLSKTSLVRLGNHLHYYPGIGKVLRSQKWDLVHIDEEPFNLCTYHVLRECRRIGTRAIFASWQNSMKTYPPPFNFFENYVFRYINGAIAGNDDVRSILRKRGFVPPIAHVPQLGVDPVMFSKRGAGELRRELGVGDTFTVGFVGRFWPVKAVDTLINAFSLLPSDSSLVLIGEGSERPKLEALAKQRGLSQRVRWLRWVNSWEVASYMNAFDVLVLPSRTRWNIKEQFGRVLVEAMSCETCVVGSDSGEIPKVIGDCGLIFPEDQVEELADQLRQLKTNVELRNSLAVRGRRRVLERFTYSKIAEATVAFYRKIALEPVAQPDCMGQNVVQPAN